VQTLFRRDGGRRLATHIFVLIAEKGIAGSPPAAMMAVGALPTARTQFYAHGSI
jgi:hypothetical protein